MEDGVSLAACVALAGKGSIPNATRVHNLLRADRVSLLQAFGVANREARDTTKNKDAKVAKLDALSSWLVEHDPEQYAIDNYSKALAHITDGTSFKSTNIPAGVTPVPWTIDGLVEAMEKGEHTFFDEDWS